MTNNNNTKTYQIVINGIQESVNAVESLNKQLDNLEKRINALQSKNINVGASTSSSSGGGSRTSDLSAEEKIQRQILNLDDKITGARSEGYKIILQQKQELKEINAIQKQNVAQTNLEGKTYANTMNGMKAHLADIKAVIHNTDLNDTETINKLTTQANEITQKLKEMEAAYGTFGRNVGNYAEGVSEGMQKVVIKVGDTERTFSNARQASLVLNNELKSMAVNSKQNTKEYKELDKVVKQLSSTLKDVSASSVVMDNLLDTMQGLTAMASTTEGLSALFGVDATALEQSIQKLVALQNVLQGIEVIRQQMKTGEGIGGMLSKGFDKIDAMAFGIKRIDVAILGTGTAAKTAAVFIKGFSMALKGIASLGLGLLLDALVEGISAVAKAVTGWVKGDADLVNAESLVEQQIEATNRKIQERNEELQKQYITNQITAEQYYAESLKETTEAIDEQIKKLKELAEERLGSDANENLGGLQSVQGKDIASTWGLTIKANDIDELTAAWEKYSTAIANNKDVVSDNQHTVGDWFKSLFISIDDTKEELTNLGQVAIGEFLSRYEHAMQTMAKDTQAGRKEIYELQKLMNSNEMMHNVLTHLDEYIPDAAVVKKLQNIYSWVMNVQTSMSDFLDRSVQNVMRSEQLKIDAMADGAAKRAAQRDYDMKKELLQEGLNAEDKLNIQKKYQNRALKEEANANRKAISARKSNGQKTVNAVKDIEAEIAKARVDAMKDGLVKTLAQLELERNKRIAEAKKTGRLVNEQIALINAYYNDKQFDAQLEYHNKLVQEEKDYNERVKELQNQRYQTAVEISKRNSQMAYETKINKVNGKDVPQLTVDYNNANDINTSDIEKYGQGIVELYVNTKTTIIAMKSLINLYDELMIKGGKLTDEEQKKYDKALKELDVAEALLKEIESQYEGIDNIKTISTNLEYAYIQRRMKRAEYYKSQLEAAQKAAKDELKIEKDRLDTELRLEEEAEKKRHKLAISSIYEEDNELGNIPKQYASKYSEIFGSGKLIGMNNDQIGTYFSNYRKAMDKWLDDLKKATNEGKVSWKEYNDVINSEAIKGYLKAKQEYENYLKIYDSGNEEQANKLKELTIVLNNAYVDYLKKVEEEETEHKNQMTVIQKKYNQASAELNRNNKKQQRAANAEYYANLESEVENVLSAINNKLSKAEKRNAWGIINLPATKKELKDLQETVNIAIDEIASQKERLLNKLKREEISFGDYDALISQLKVVETQASETATNVQNKLKDLTGDWWAGIDQWVQQVGQSMNSILSSFSEIQTNQYDKMIEQQEKYIEQYEELLSEQEEITQNHADAVSSIEDELSTARGDRRQQLIDMLNAEMAAQRASLAQEKKIAKEKEKAEEKKKKLEHEQAVQKKKMDLAQAYINAAMAISMAAVNHWPIPAIPMMAMAAAVGAAQIAAVKSQNIPSYGEGGILVGKTHAQGGIKVLGGTAEVEGGEYITNKITTSKNVELMDYINSKKKRINLDDMIEFYSNGKSIKKNISSVRTKFSNGGQLPTLRSDISLNDRLVSAMEDYSNRPVVVEVTEIMNKADNVRNVQVLAGLTD